MAEAFSGILLLGSLISVVGQAVMGFIAGRQVAFVSLANRTSRGSTVRLTALLSLASGTGLLLLALLTLFVAMLAEPDYGYRQRVDEELVTIAVIGGGLCGLLALGQGVAAWKVAQAMLAEVTDEFGLRDNLLDPHWWLRLTAYGPLLLIASCILLLLPILLFGLGAILVMTWPAMCGLFWNRRPAQLLSHLSLAVKNNRDLSRELRDYATTCWPGYARRLERCADLIAAGASLGEAMQATGRILPRWLVASIRMAEADGTLTTELPRLSKHQLDVLQVDYTRASVARWLFLVTATLNLGVMVVGFIMVFIIPKFKAIFDGFGTELPKATMVLIEVSDFVADWWFTLAPVCLLAGWGVIEALLGEATGWKTLRMRSLKWLYPKLDGPDVLRHLAATIELGRPLTDGLNALATHYFRPTVRQALQRVNEAVTGGADCWEWLAREGFIAAGDLELLIAATRVGNLSWALREIAELRERRLKYRAQVFMEFSRPVPVFIAAAIVFCIVVPLFLPLIKLTNDLS